MTPLEIGEKWLDSWRQRDPDALVALYAEDARHTSPKLRALRPDTGGFLTGREQVRAWFADAMQRLPGLRYVPLALTADAKRVCLEYRRENPGEPDLLVAEVLEVRDGRIVSSRVFHG